MTLPVLYSFRRCPYAMRARLAIAACSVEVELREVVLRDKPAALLALSPKGTVPVLALADGQVLDQSFDIMDWAHRTGTPPATMTAFGAEDFELVWRNDSEFKQTLDRYKYADRHPQHPAEFYRAQGEDFLARCEQRLTLNPWLAGPALGLADLAIAPFVRQFAQVDRAWFDGAPYPALVAWLQGILDSELFARIMARYPQWVPGETGVVFPAGV